MKRVARVLRRVLLGLLVLLVVVTGASLTYNAFTGDHEAPPDGLRFAAAGDVNTRYETWGTTGTPVVLVHGSAESVETWSKLVPLLAQDHRVYAYDITGYGYSERKAPYTVEHLAAQLLGFLDAMHLGGPGQPRPILVGHSLGAGIAAEATLEAPARIGGLMFLDGDALPLPGQRASFVRHVFVNPYKTSILRLVLGSDAIVRKAYTSACAQGCPALDHAAVDQWTRPFRQPGAENALWQMTADGIPAVSPERLTTFKTLKVPTSVVFGALDTQGGSAPETATRIGAPPPTIIPNAGHLTLISAPAEVTAAINALATRETA
ncbi:alpha/beta fold hydrolase [Kribbella qitaiheensis]|uniref:alpha/beta fold hydrolase n=1 Tax=Kribbella qitaiheensis TaxID=1544730 RepID=UPI00162432A5|nr:alpha/beta hydrolase [Kribbella qitaiheensis]